MKTTQFLTEAQITLIRMNWAALVPYADDVADLFFRNLFDHQPTFREAFSHEPLAKHRQRLVVALEGTIRSLDRLDLVRSSIATFGRGCLAIGVVGPQYDAIGAVLIRTIGDALEHEFSDDAKIAWARAFAIVAEVMTHAEALEQSERPALHAAEGEGVAAGM